jgi:predicted negative regulator of RcsB-dependent stress response
MKRLLIVFLLVVAGVVGLGFYLGWFQLSTISTDQKTNISITVDQNKMREDEEKAKEKVQDAGHKLKEQTGTEKSRD